MQDVANERAEEVACDGLRSRQVIGEMVSCPLSAGERTWKHVNRTATDRCGENIYTTITKRGGNDDNQDKRGSAQFDKGEEERRLWIESGNEEKGGVKIGKA